MPEPNLSSAEQEAVRWCVKRHSGDWKASDERSFERWQIASEANRQAYLRVEGAWRVAGQLPTRDKPAQALRDRGYRPVAFALLVLAVLVPFLAWEGERWWLGAPETVATTRGQFRTVTLADGSEIRLDADSEAVLRIGFHGRSARLVRGAALFVVAHDEARPFEVEAGSGRIVDLGTRFDVDLRAGGVQVSVFEGRVAVHTANGDTELTAGQGGGYSAGGVMAPTVAVVGVGPAWQEGRLTFRNEPLDEALQRLARYHAVRFEFAELDLAGLRISGQFRVDDLALFLRTLEAGFPVKAMRPEAGLIVFKRVSLGG